MNPTNARIVELKNIWKHNYVTCSISGDGFISDWFSVIAYEGGDRYMTLEEWHWCKDNFCVDVRVYVCIPKWGK